MLKVNSLCVIGLGYIGLPTACTFAAHGIDVLGVDTNPQVIETLQSGGLHLHEPGLQEIVDAAFRSGKLRVSSGAAPADAFIIAVPTPIRTDKSSDLRAVIAAAESIVNCLQPGNLVVLESTSPPRTTTDVVVPILERSGLKAGTDFYVAYSPERVLPGQILRELVENARVIGGIDRSSAEAGRDLYGVFVRGEIVLADATTAEMVKLMENTFRDVNIAVANEFSRLADSFGVDVWQAIEIANRHPRVNILNPGPGVGGHCISVDPWFLVEAAPELTALIRTAREVNDRQPEFVVELVRRALGTLIGKRIAVLGLAYKPNVDDLRESPAVEVAQLLTRHGAVVEAYEPFKLGAELPGIPLAGTLDAAIGSADAVLLLVGHDQFQQLVPFDVIQRTTARTVIDTVGVWNLTDWEAAGFRAYRIGRGEHRMPQEQVR